MGSFVFHNRDRFSYNGPFVPADIDIWQKPTGNAHGARDPAAENNRQQPHFSPFLPFQPLFPPFPL